MSGVGLFLVAIFLALLLAATIYFLPSGNPAREAKASILVLPLIGTVAVLIGGYRN
jgi:hypothetical protein